MGLFFQLLGTFSTRRQLREESRECMPDKSRTTRQQGGEGGRAAAARRQQAAGATASEQRSPLKRKQPERPSSSSEEEEVSDSDSDYSTGRGRRRPQSVRRGGAQPPAGRVPPGRAAAAAAAQQQPAPSQQPEPSRATGLKRVRSSWKMRPLIIDEKLHVFIEGETDELLHWDGGEFYQWLKDCEDGRADPAEGFPYPLLVQDQDLRTVLEIRPPEQQAIQAQLRCEGGAAALVASAEAEAIVVPRIRALPAREQPDVLAAAGPAAVPVVQRAPEEGPSGAPLPAGGRAAAGAAAQGDALSADPPYIRYVQPTPDELDLAVEYDLDEEDEEWLAAFNEQARKAKSRKGRRQLGEEWMEHLIDRMEKDYTAELQKHPEHWVVQRPEGGGEDTPPTILLPPIEEVFPLEACLQVPGINHYDNIIKAVYEYWKAKHQREGRPLIQRLWYEPPWHQRKAAALADGADDGDGPFAALDSPNIRKRRLEPDEVQNRFAEIRRDLELVRTLADQLRRREKLKRRELQLHREEWAARLQALREGNEALAGIQGGRLRRPPAPLSTVARIAAAQEAEEEAESAEGLSSGEDGEGEALMHAIAEGRAARLAHRRSARDAVLGGAPPIAPAAAWRRPPPASRRQASPARRQGGGQRQQGGGSSHAVVLKQEGNMRGPPPAPGVWRDEKCLWCGSDEFLMLGCSQCHRVFCFKCFQRRPGYGINNWSRAIKDPAYQCVVCRGIETDDTSANTAARLGDHADAADTTHGDPAMQARPLVGAAARSHAARLAREAAEAAAGSQDEDEGEDEEKSDERQPARRLVGAAARSHAARLAREAAAAGPSSSEEDEEESSEESGQPARRLVGAAARSHAARLAREAAAAEEGVGSESSEGEEDRPARRLGGAAARSHAARLAREEEPRPARRLGGAAARSHAARLAREAAEAEAAGTGESDADSDEDQAKPERKLGGAAARSHAARLVREAAEAAAAAGAAARQPWPPGRLGGGAGARAPGAHAARQAPDAEQPGGRPASAKRVHVVRFARQVEEAEFLADEGEEREEGSTQEDEDSDYKPQARSPRRKLGGAAAASHAARLAREAAEAAAEESSEEEEEEEEEEDAEAEEDEEQPRGRRLGGAAAASHAARLAREAAEAAAGAQRKAQQRGGRRPLGGSSSPRKEPGRNGYVAATSSSDADSDGAATAGSSESESERPLQPTAKENRAPQPPVKRARVGGGARQPPAAVARQPESRRQRSRLW
eukprot:scaffold12.g8161.t1